MRKQLLTSALVSLIAPAITMAAGTTIKPNPLNDPTAVVSKCKTDRDETSCSIVALIDRSNVIYGGSAAAVDLDLMDIDLGGSFQKKGKSYLQADFKKGFDAAPVVRLLDVADKLATTQSARTLVASHRSILMGCFSTTTPTPEATKDHEAYAQQVKACEARLARSLDAVARQLNQPSNLPEFDFRKSRWGDTEQAVISSEGKPARQTPDSLVFESSVSDLKAMAVYHFAAGKLTNAGYVIHEEHTDDDRYVTDFKAVSDGLTTKYGKATYSLVESENNALKSDHDRWGRGIVLGQLSLHDDWDLPITQVDHYIASDNFKVTHIVKYASHEFAAERQKQKAAANASGL